MNIKSFNKIKEKNYVLKLYLNDIKKCSEPLSSDEEKSLLKQYYSEETSAEDKVRIKQRIVMANQRFLYDMASCYSGNNNELLLELINVGTMGLYETFDNYDISKGIKFMTYAQFYIRRAINSFIKDDILLIKKSNSAKLNPKIKVIQEEFQNKNGRRADIFELEDILKKQYNIDINDRNDLYATQIERIEDPSAVDDDTFIFENSKKFTVYASVENDYMVQAEKEGTASEINKILKRLPERESTIIKMAYGIGDYIKPYNNQEIGEALGLTSERVRQLKTLAESKIKSLYKKIEH